jgi:hypothetical protein
MPHSFRRLLVAAAIAALIPACGTKRESNAPAEPPGAPGLSQAATMAAPALMEESNARAVTPPSALPTSASQDSIVPSMIIRTGQAYIEVDSLELGIAQVQRLARIVGGYIANSSVQAGEGQQRSATLEIKVAAARYDQALNGLTGIGKLLSSTTSAQDVGEEFVDVTARVANARRLEERLLTLLATRTGRLDDVLAVERELARVREEIERYDGRLRFLRSRIAVSTLTVTVAERGPIVGQPGSNVIIEAFKRAWRNFVNVIASGIELMGGLLPLLALVVLAAFGWRRWRRWRRDASAAHHPASAAPMPPPGASTPQP